MKPKSVGNEIVEHWYSLVAGQQFSTKEFYDHIESEIHAQRVPALQAERVDLSEGGVLSDKREYLRMERERIRFDICAAPVGVNYFFSYRFYRVPAIVQPWEMVTFLVIIGAIFNLAVRYIGVVTGPIFLALGLGILVWVMRNAVGMGLRDVDAALLKIPILAPIYEAYFRRDTYYRQDVRIAYCSIVSGIVKQEVTRITGEKGVKLLREFTYNPVMSDLYRAKETTVLASVEAQPVSG